MLNNAGPALLLGLRKRSRRFKAGRGGLVVPGRRSRVLEGPHQGVRGGGPAARGRARLDPVQRYRDRKSSGSKLSGMITFVKYL